MAATANHTLTGYEPAAREAVVDFQRHLWKGGRERNGAYLDWKYHRNPYLDDRYLVLAWDRDALVGMVGGFGAAWAIGGQRVVLPCLADTVVAPRLRSGPLFADMLAELVDRLRADGVPWLLDFGDQPAGPALLMRGWVPIGPWTVAKAARSGAVVGGAAWRTAPGTEWEGPRSGCAISPRGELDATTAEAMAGLVAGQPSPKRVRHVRDAEYFTWRAQNPLAHYYYLLARRDGELRGYLVAHRTRVDALDGETPTTIVECEAADDDVWADLVSTSLRVLPGSVVLLWVRDLGAGRNAHLDALPFQSTH